MPFEPFVALRYLIGKRRSFLVWVITLLSVLGVVAGVAALDITLSVMGGFEDDLKAKILGMNSHAVVLKFGGEITEWEDVLARVRSSDHVVAATPFTYNEIMLQSDSGVTGAVLKGADPETIGKVTSLVENVCLPDEEANRCGLSAFDRDDDRQAVLSKINEMQPVENRDKPVPGILLGRELADQLLVLPGELVRVIAPTGAVGPGGAYPKMKTFKVVGTFKTGMWEYDTKFAFVSIPAAQSVSGDSKGITGIEVKFDDAYRAPAIADGLEVALEYPFTVKDWVELNGALFGALKLEKIVMGLLLGIILIVAGFLIFSILTIIVLEKRDEIAILKTLGASNPAVLGIFTIQGTVIGIIGTLGGTVLGWVGSLVLKAWRFPLDTRVYYLDTVPVVLHPLNFAIVAVAAVCISVLAVLIPSLVAAAQDPVQGLRHE